MWIESLGWGVAGETPLGLVRGWSFALLSQMNLSTLSADLLRVCVHARTCAYVCNLTVLTC